MIRQEIGRRRFLALSGKGLLAVALVSCQPAAPTPAPTTAPAAKPTAAPAAAQPVVVSIGTISNIQSLAPWVGVEKGIYLKHGIDLKVKMFPSGAEGLKAIQTGETQITNVAPATIAVARSQGINLKIIAMISNDATAALADDAYAIIADGKSGITKIADLAGKRIATTAGNTPDIYVRAVLARAGIPDNKVELVNAPQGNMRTVLGSGVDAVTTTEPYGEQVLASVSGAREIVRGGGYVAQRVSMAAMEDWIATNRPIAEKIVLANAEALQYARLHLDEAGDIASRWLTTIDAALLRKAIRRLGMDPRLSKAVREGWDFEMQALIDQKKAKEKLPFEGGVEVSLQEGLATKYPELVNDLKPAP